MRLVSLFIENTNIGDIPESLKTPKWKISQLPSRLLEICNHKEHVIIGANAVTRKIKELALVVFFANAGNLVAQFPTLCLLAGVPCSAAEKPTPELIELLRIRTIACIGVRRSAQELSHFAELLLEVQRNPVIEDIPFGNFQAAKRSMTESSPVKAVVKPLIKTSQPNLTNLKTVPKSTGGKKRFFSSLD